MLDKIKTKKVLIRFIIVVSIVFSAFMYKTLNVPDVEFYEVVPITIKETILSAGRVEELERTNVSFTVPGSIKIIHKNEGAVIAKGELLAELANDQEWNQLRLAKNQQAAANNQREIAINQYQSADYHYQAASMQYASVVSLSLTKEPELLETARLQLQQSEITYHNQLQQKERLASLVKAGAIPVKDLEDMENAIELTVTKMELAKNELKTLLEGGSNWQDLRDRIQQAELQLAQVAIQKEQASMQVTQAENSLLQADIQIEQAELYIENKRLYSPIQGTILQVNKKTGEYSNPGEVLIEIGVPRTRVIATVDEKDYENLALGQVAYIRPQSSDSDTYEARVALIAPEVDARRGIIEVTLDFVDSNVTLKPKSAVTVEFLVRTFADALAIPTSYLFYEANQAHVWVYNHDNSIQKVPIQTKNVLGQWVMLDHDTDLAIDGQKLVIPDSYKEGQKVSLLTAGERE